MLLLALSFIEMIFKGKAILSEILIMGALANVVSFLLFGLSFFSKIGFSSRLTFLFLFPQDESVNKKSKKLL